MEKNNDQTNKENQQDTLKLHQPKVSIQQAFKKFQKEKFYQLKLNKYLKNVEKDRASPQFKQELRDKFIQTAKKYIGIPYAQKFHQPGDQHYDAPLFLDCCALVRQCVFDLRQEFGFTLGKWNQAYQFDMLPDQKLQQKDLKPGDLIFYSATYYNEKLKPFPHKMVHIQIYLGQGKSIGARWQKGTIKIFDSYKFESTLYHDIQFHYRSIDSWLEGKCQNHCQQHKWLDDRANQWLSDKFSVFADPSLDDMNITSKENDQSRKVMIGKGNNCKLIKQYFYSKEGYSILPQKDQFSPHYYYKWVQSAGQVDFFSFDQNKQLVNHIPNISVISSKLQLLKTLKQLQLQCQTKGKPMITKLDNFIPKTYRLNIMSDQIQFLNDKTNGIWIYKPRNLNQGKGIRIIADIQQFKKQFINSKKFYLGEFSLNNMLHYKPDLLENNKQMEQRQSQKKEQQQYQSQQKRQLSQSQTKQSVSQVKQSKYSQLNHDGLIQHYIRPLLLNGKKFDIRCYMLLYSNPAIVFFHQGYLRLTLQDYSQEDMQSDQKLFIHLTNNCYQNKHKDYKAKKDQTIANWKTFEQVIGKQKINSIRHQIKRIMITVYAAAQRKLIKKKGTYQLLGFDILIDQNCKPYLLEVNTNPAMFLDTKVQKEIIPVVAKNSLDIALGMFNQPQNQQIYSNNAIKDGLQLLYSQKRGFIYNIENQIKNFGFKVEQNDKTVQINGLKGKI